ncbi:hypothetical protein L1887_18039 [Cichorium endivia]|nr:hypothetical protein L1887_18039 [Cichorium endivia]
MRKQSKIDGFLKRKNASSSQNPEQPPEIVLDENPQPSNIPVMENPPKRAQVEINEVDLNTLERDPGLRKQIYDYPVNQRDTIRRGYMNLGPFQPKLSVYPKSGPLSHRRSFQFAWFKLFSWLEYSPSLDAAFCFPCYLFYKPSGMGQYGQQAFTIEGCRNWKKVGGKECVFLNHMGNGCTSFHNIAQKACYDLLKQEQDIRYVIEKVTEEELKKNRLRLTATIYAVRWCAFQAVAFRGHNERSDSINKGNFREMLEAICAFNAEIRELFRIAPSNALYTSPSIQKEILNFISIRVRRMICEEIGGGKFCLIVDEARDESNREQMSIVLRFVNKDGVVMERFFGLVHVQDTTAKTLKNGIHSVLSRNNLDFKSIRGQGYDGASNMRGQFKGLQALIPNECPYAYYIHCFAHRLQLALMAASQGVVALRKFFTQLSSVVNVVCASSKRTDQLRDAQAENIAYLISIDELETGKGLNQIGTLQRAGDTRWSSHLKSILSLINMFSPTCEVLLKIIEEGTGSIRGDADAVYETITTFEFVFVLHLEKEIMEITDLLCQSLQRQSQDICNALNVVASTKTLLQKMKDERWDGLLSTVKSFCQVRNIDIPDLSSSYFTRGARARNEHSDHTLEHHYRVDIFYEAINCQIMELNHRFNDSSMELLQLSATLDPKSANEHFRANDVCELVEKYYPEDFSEQEKHVLKIQLKHYETDVINHPDYKSLKSISGLCQWLVKTRRITNFDLIYRVVSLILTLPVSTATTERTFSAMSLMKTRLRNKMEDEFLNDSLVLYFERELAEKISLETILEDFRKAKDRRIPL